MNLIEKKFIFSSIFLPKKFGISKLYIIFALSKFNNDKFTQTFLTDKIFTAMTITLRYNKINKVYQATGKDATIVWDALGLNTTFKVEDNLPVIVLPKNVDKFTAKMKENYNINVITK